MKDLTMDKKPDFDGYIIVGIIVALTIGLVFATEGMRADIDQREAIGKSLCENHSFIYKDYDLFKKTISCDTNITYNGDHFNITPETLKVIITPDWAYYLNTTKKGENK